MTSQWVRPLEVSTTPTQIPGSLPNTPRERLYLDDFVHSSCRKSVCLLTCLHFEISSVLLLKMFFPLNNAISRFSYRQRLYLSDERLKREHILRILHLILGERISKFYLPKFCYFWACVGMWWTLCIIIYLLVNDSHWWVIHTSTKVRLGACGWLVDIMH